MKWTCHAVSLAAAVAVLGLALATEIGNPELTRTQLLMTFWPRYCLMVVMLAVAIGAELVATEPGRR